MRHTRAWGLAAVGAAAGVVWGPFSIGGCAGQPKDPGPGSVFGVEEEPVAPASGTPRVSPTPRGQTAAAPETRPAPRPAPVRPPARSAEGPLRAELVGLRVERELRYVPWEPDQPGPVALRIERDAPAPDGAPWHVRRYTTRADGRESLETDYLYILTPEGDVAISEMIEHADRVEVVFDPPLIVIPATLERGDTRTQSTRMTVHPLGDRSRTQNAGDAVNEITYVDNERVRTPALDADAPAFPARHLRTTMTANLGGPQVRNVTDIWLVDGLGIVSEQRHERTTLLGAPVRNNVQRWALAATGPRSAATAPDPTRAAAAPAAAGATPGSR